MSSSNGLGPSDRLSYVLANQLSTDSISELLENTVLRPPSENPSNSQLFHRFLELVTSECSSGSRFHCGGPESCCAPCRVLHHHIKTYVDVATLDEIQSLRKECGLCGYVYCNSRLIRGSKGGSGSSTFKIDLSSQRVFRRDVYDSFCSSVCIDKNEDVTAAASNSPMETGVITPRAVRNSSTKSLQTLVSGMLKLASCERLVEPSKVNRVTVPTPVYRGHDPEMLNDKCVMFNYKSISDVRHVRFAEPLESVECISPRRIVELSAPSDDISVDPSSVASAVSDSDVTKNAVKDGYLDNSDLYDLSEISKPRDKSRAWYKALLVYVPEVLLPTLSEPLQCLVSTFRIGKNTPELESHHFRVLSHVLLYVLLRDGDRVLTFVSNRGDLERLLREVEDYLTKSCMLQSDSISVLYELFTECE
uniref:RTR1-type domain-containing protein n=1 Tax=Babesia bovis TaxID=5865 RepID=A7ASM8_BABBO|eukprot:XP_001611115.1 hypothetical protein [Babesia bovis T2Bo]